MIEARYFDGQTAKAHAVRLGIQADHVVLTDAQGTVVLRQALSRVQVQERMNWVAQRIDLGGGAVIEVPDAAALEELLRQAGIEPSMIQRAQRSWTWVAGSIAGILLSAVLLYMYGLPWGAAAVAHALPESVEQSLGEQAWPALESEMFKPSELPEARRNALTERFTQLASATAPQTKYELVFRKSTIGPNAFAMPGGRIVMTDELVMLSKDDDAVIGVLAHELGHVVYRHSMRNLIQTAAVGALVSIWLGDMSSLVATIPTAMAVMKYSRDFEHEADAFALKALRQTGRSAEPLADLLEQLQGQSSGSGMPAILSSHPMTEERAKRLRAGQ